ncbi:MAG: ATP-dependent Clp protease adaptor ClpS [Deltaproteobacteria bacterium]|nr:ATP-dependent Clp protease adaptor ClpS [Deltaproteobacteria bacterium]MCX7952400.1 ATP-dependent Clp protease adaptor ClpS [Deltaproteobacteria bacterium]
MVSLKVKDWLKVLTGMPKANRVLKEKKKTVSITPKLCKVILLNDDYTPMQFVVEILVNIFGKGYSEAVSLMLKVHTEGSAVCGEYPKEVAETKASLTVSIARQNGYPLQAIVEP